MSHVKARDPRGRTPASFVVTVSVAVLALALAAVLWGLRLSGGRPRSVVAPDGPRTSHPAPPRPHQAPVRHRDPFTAAAVAQVDQRGGTVLAAVFDLGTGQSWTLGQGRPQAEASVVKLDILETLLARHRGYLPAGDLQLAREMIEDSDNAAATSLWYAAGGPGGIRSFNAAAGLRDTVPSACVRCPGFPWPGWGLTSTTPADQVMLLRQLAGPGSRLTAGQRAYVLRLMENVAPAQRWGVSGGVPAQVTVALKNGWLPLNGTADWQINSVGWISGGGRDYLMAVLTTGNPTEHYGIATIGLLSAAVWRNMG